MVLGSGAGLAAGPESLGCLDRFDGKLQAMQHRLAQVLWPCKAPGQAQAQC
jgi:hypothetical protein